MDRLASAPARLAAFAALLALVFAAALATGGVAGPQRDGEDRGATAGHGAGGSAPEGEHGDTRAMASAHGAAQPVRGLGISEGGLGLRLATPAATAGRTTLLRFAIADAHGETVRAFDVEHARRMHVIVVRRDLTGFQHLHPEQRRDGSWAVPLRLEDAGTYRVFADFSHDGTARTLAADLQVDGTVRSRPLPEPAPATEVDGLQVRLAAPAAARAGAQQELGFAVTRNGRAVRIADYLGAKGHLVALREGDLAFLHVHPDADRLSFAATFPTPGRYRLFLQFETGGAVHTAAFTREVAR